MNARPSLIYNDPPAKTRADYIGLSDREIWRQWTIESNREEASFDDDGERYAARRSLDIIRLVMEERGILKTNVVRF